MRMSITPCECAQPGWCARHGFFKSDLHHALCQRSHAHFQMAEAWRPTEPLAPSHAIAPTIDQKTSRPSVWQRTSNFLAEFRRHIANRFRRVSPDVANARLDICRQCPACDTKRLVCQEKACGCYLVVKVTWESAQCPQGRWQHPSPDDHPKTN